MFILTVVSKTFFLTLKLLNSLKEERINLDFEFIKYSLFVSIFNHLFYSQVQLV